MKTLLQALSESPDLDPAFREILGWIAVARDACAYCEGTGIVNGDRCTNCNGNGYVVTEA